MLPMAIALLDLLSYVSKSCKLSILQYLGEDLPAARSTTAVDNYHALFIVVQVHYGVSIANSEAIFKALKEPSLVFSAFQQTLSYYFAGDPDLAYYFAGDHEKHTQTQNIHTNTNT